jgi:hypothetical protein
MSRLFPIQGGKPVAWAIAERAYVGYRHLYSDQQSLERLAERGGFSKQELAAYTAVAAKLEENPANAKTELYAIEDRYMRYHDPACCVFSTSAVCDCTCGLA